MIKVCSLFSGSSGNSIFMSTENTRILIDAGLSGIKIRKALESIGESPCDLNAILVSHEHSDHVKGVGIISRKFDIPVFANESTWKAMEQNLGEISPHNRISFETGRTFELGDINIKAFSIPHDASEPVGFNFFVDNKKLSHATDIGHMNSELLSHIENSDLLLLESNHDEEMLKVGKYPWSLKQRIMGKYGHLCNEMAAKVITYLAEKGTKNFLLGHLSHENNFPELAYQTTCNALKEKDIEIGKDVMVDVILRDRVGRIIEV